MKIKIQKKNKYMQVYGPDVVYVVQFCCRPRINIFLDDGFKYLLFSPLLGEDSHFD